MTEIMWKRNKASESVSRKFSVAMSNNCMVSTSANS